MQISRKYSKKTQIIIGLAAVVIAISWSFSAFVWFKQSEDWGEIKKLIVSHPKIIHETGVVKSVSLSYFGFSYKYRGEWAKADLVASVVGSSSQKTYKFKSEKNKGAWKMKKISNH